MSKGLFITGTGTDIGKTYVTGLILKKLRGSGRNAAYFKAAMSGNERDLSGSLIPGDAVHVKTLSGIDQPLSEMCPYVYRTAVSPHLASKIEGGPVDMKTVMEGYSKVCNKYDLVTVEGSGGIICPIRFDNEKLFLEDIIRQLDLPCLIIADAGLGTINNVVLTCKYMQSHGLKVKGIIFNNFSEGDIMHEDNKRMCEYLTNLQVIACVPKNSSCIDIDPDFLASLYE